MPQHQHLFSLQLFYGCENADGTALIIDEMKGGNAERTEHPLEADTTSTE
jgi:hypothetical protein